ncbi:MULTISPECIES: Bug family tripartite tricarboxylate transporter substrate binding protein [Bordetella]|uniref:Putattive exported protein n=2 Tax=Bordetella TaxID=517 RepID=K0MGD5_BORPB|nr:MULTISPECIES: tripartite tricarboxylate transporter substrate binding protein [Bordetella]KAK64301.1 tripartite tricarboxylate transporter family receptor [Bordetella bronchiseptica 980-2]KCV33534.1 tripartite tricarboxylate transporter family receptor [Bordetella bronchiseptica 00-P-2730]KDD64517.1 tripartite tricarboxylate transporter family receptor [Bordetella bronchiseptica OSU553]AMG89736.1 tripartite tricarboxylate transporter substrate binding protein [Bordetella bronchiseptica]AWP7
MTFITLRAQACLAALLALAGASGAMAAGYPAQPIRLIVPYAAGGTTDLIARLVGQHMGTKLGQPVIVENKAGAGGNIGTEQVSRATPDGYTLLLGTAGNMTVNQAIYKDMAFDPNKDFQPISLIATLPNLMVVNKAVPAQTTKEFVAWAKENPKTVFFASSGVGSTTHLTGELFNMATGLHMEHVPYKGSGPALIDLVGGTGPVVMFDNMPSAIALVRDGSLRALAVTGPDRESSAKDIPTVKESGYPDFDVVTWFGLFAPAGTPADVVQKLNKTVQEVVHSPQVSKRLSELGATPKTNSPQEYATIMKDDTAKWAKVVKTANIVKP